MNENERIIAVLERIAVALEDFLAIEFSACTRPSQYNKLTSCRFLALLLSRQQHCRHLANGQNRLSLAALGSLKRLQFQTNPVIRLGEQRNSSCSQGGLESWAKGEECDARTAGTASL